MKHSYALTRFVLVLLLSILVGGNLSAFGDEKPGGKTNIAKLPAPKTSTIGVGGTKKPVNADPIRFTLISTRQAVVAGEEITLTITETDLNISSALLFSFAGQKSFALKILMPKGFVKTGGDYEDYIGATLSPDRPTVSYTVKGYFTNFTGEARFRLLRGPKQADASSLFIEKAGLSVFVKS